jgi:hypothetical protein
MSLLNRAVVAFSFILPVWLTACAGGVPPLSAGVAPRGSRVVMDGRGLTGDAREFQYGFATEVRGYPFVADELYAGLENGLAWEEGTSCCDLWHTNALFGYAAVPRGPRRVFGVDAGIAAGFGRVPVADDVATAASAGVRLAPLWKPGFFCSECEATSLVAYRTLLVFPDLGVTWHFPLTGERRAVQTEIHLGIGVRLEVAVLP